MATVVKAFQTSLNWGSLHVCPWTVEYDKVSGMGLTPEAALADFLECRSLFVPEDREKYVLPKGLMIEFRSEPLREVQQ